MIATPPSLPKTTFGAIIEPITVDQYHASMRRDAKESVCEATVKVRVGDKTAHTVAEGDGPVNALDGALRRALEASGIEPSRVVIAGGRDFDPEELEFIAANEMLLVPTAEIARDLGAAARKIADRLEGQKVHVSLDIDVLGAAYLGGAPLRPFAVGGRIDEHTDGAIDALDRSLRTAQAPWATTNF